MKKWLIKFRKGLIAIARREKTYGIPIAKKRKVKTFFGQKATVPIKDKRYINLITDYFLKEYDRAKTPLKQSQADRNWLLVYLGFNTAFRTEDLLQLRLADMHNGYMRIKENKTGKTQNFRLSKAVYQNVLDYVERNKLTSYDYLFNGQKNREFAITRQQADRILHNAAKAVKLPQPFSMHAMRKTFGYQFILAGGQILTLSKMYNHDDVPTTEIYICWGMDDVDKARSNVNLGSTPLKRKGKIKQ